MATDVHAALRAVPTILLVDDDEDIRVSFRRYVRSCLPQARLLMAPNGREGLAVLARERVDIVLSDYRMPGMDGLSFLAQAARVQPGSVRALVTAYDDPALGAAERADGTIDVLLRKPLEPETLGPILLALLQADPRTAA